MTTNTIPQTIQDILDCLIPGETPSKVEPSYIEFRMDDHRKVRDLQAKLEYYGLCADFERWPNEPHSTLRVHLNIPK